MNWFPEHLKRIIDIYGPGNVGLITFKEILKPKYKELFDIKYFGNLRSSNIFEDRRVLIVLGTYFGTDAQVFDYLERIFDMHDRRQIVEEEDDPQDDGRPE